MEENTHVNIDLEYGSDAIKTLDWKEHIRRRPGMYIGKLGDGSHADDGIYVLLKEVLDNALDEHMMGFGKQIVVEISPEVVSVRDYGRGIPLDKVRDVSSKMNTGGKYDSKAFKKSVGLNGVGIKAVNALSSSFFIQSYRDGMSNSVSYARGEVISESGLTPTDELNGTLVQFAPDNTIFKNYAYREELIVPLLKNYVFLNTGLTILLNGRRYHSRNGLVDLLNENMTTDPLYPIIHLSGTDIEVVITHGNQYGEEYYSFVNGQHTTQGGTHLTAFRESVSRTIKEFYNKNFEYTDIRNGMVAAISIKVEEPVFESQTKTKLGSKDMGPEGPTVAKFIGDFLKKELDNYLHKHGDVAEVMLKKILASEKERKAIAGVDEAGPRTGQEGEPQQPQVARLPHTLQRCEGRPARRELHIHYRGRLGQRLDYQDSQRRDSGRILAAGGSPSTPTASPRRWCMKTRSSTCCRRLSISRRVSRGCATTR